ncbi:hypothetical protein DPMN_157886 [Dreissena polymorpha]|uniref:Uncharacterized protein n=1 Tax=Dreissena polymorpha TaxID=45954 RepID=A0A9D4EI18_DREPO|nr:hypothetical protein DPMN_157886 [Dreissena polymorpha]
MKVQALISNGDLLSEETAYRRDSIEIQGFLVRYPSSLRIDPLVLLRAQSIAPIHARITWVLYQYISSGKHLKHF